MFRGGPRHASWIGGSIDPSSTPFPLIVSLFPSSVAEESRGKNGELHVERIENGKRSARFARDARIL